MDAIDTLTRSPLFSGVEKSTLQAIARSLVAEHWTQHAEIMTPEQTAHRFFIIVEGRVKITCSNQNDGRELTVWLLGPGDAFDMVSLLDGGTHDVSAWALDDVRTLSAPVTTLRSWVERSPSFRLAAHRYVARQLRELTTLASDLALHGTMQRLAHLLLRHFDTSAKSARNPPAGNLIRDLSHEDLAYLIGSVRVVVSRLLGQLKREGVIDTRGGVLQVLNLKKLLRRAEREMISTRPEAKARSK